MQKLRLDQLTENKVIVVQLKEGQRVRHSISSLTFNGQYSSKSTWFAGKTPVLEIINAIPGAWRIAIKNNKLAGYYFIPREKSDYKWEIRFDDK